MTIERKNGENTSRARLKILFINGTVLKAERRDILRWLTEPTTGILLGIATAFFLIYFAYLGRNEYLPGEVWQVAVTVVVFVVAFFALVLSFVFLAFYVVRFQPNFVLPMPLVIVAAHVINQVVSAAVVQHWGVYLPDSALLYLRIIKIYFFVLSLEILYSAYLLPHSRLYKNRLYQCFSAQSFEQPAPENTSFQEANVKEEPTEECPVESVADDVEEVTHKALRVGDREIKCGEIRMIRAEQNYIRVETASDSILVRAKMKDTLRTICPSLGVQAHRSCWVSFKSVAGTKTLPNGRLSLELSDGEVITVPRARRRLVLDALKRSA